MFEPAVALALMFVGLAVMRLGIRYRRRRQELAALAVALGMKFHGEDHVRLLARLSRFALLQGGHSPRVQNVFGGRHGGCQVLACDYCYEKGIGLGRRLLRRSAVLWSLPEAGPAFVYGGGGPRKLPGRCGRFQRCRLAKGPLAGGTPVCSDNAIAVRKLLTEELQTLLSRCEGTTWQSRRRYVLFVTEGLASAVELNSLLCRSWRCVAVLAGVTDEQPFAFVE